jgi:fructose-1-phosphate kinase PfkB-like protein
MNRNVTAVDEDASLEKASAVAAGTATTLRPGTALCQKDDFLKLVPKVKLTSV